MLVLKPLLKTRFTVILKTMIRSPLLSLLCTSYPQKEVYERHSYEMYASIIVNNYIGTTLLQL